MLLPDSRASGGSNAHLVTLAEVAAAEPPSLSHSGVCFASSARQCKAWWVKFTPWFCNPWGIALIAGLPCHCWDGICQVLEVDAKGEVGRSLVHPKLRNCRTDVVVKLSSVFAESYLLHAESTAALTLQPRWRRGKGTGELAALLQPRRTKASFQRCSERPVGLCPSSDRVHAFQLRPWGDSPEWSLQPDFLSFQLKASSESENESPKRRGQKQMKKT